MLRVVFPLVVAFHVAVQGEVSMPKPLYRWTMVNRSSVTAALTDRMQSIKLQITGNAVVDAVGLRLHAATNDMAMTEHDLPIPTSASKTLAAWIILDGPISGCILSLDESYIESPFQYIFQFYESLCVKNGQWQIESENGRRSGSAGAQSVPSQQIHVAACFDAQANKIEVYKNGQFVGSIQTQEAPRQFDTAARVVLGQSSFNAVDNADVTIQTVQVFDEALSAEQIGVLAAIPAGVLACDAAVGWTEVRSQLRRGGVPIPQNYFPTIDDNLAGTAPASIASDPYFNIPFPTPFNQYLIQIGEICDQYIVFDKCMLEYAPTLPMGQDYYTIARGDGVSNYEADVIWTTTGTAFEPTITRQFGTVLYREFGAPLQDLDRVVFVRNVVQDDLACFSIAVGADPWELVRHLPKGSATWYSAADNLAGTFDISPGGGGVAVSNPSAFAVPYSPASVDDFLFTTSHCQKWIVISKTNLDTALAPCVPATDCHVSVTATESFINPAPHSVTATITAAGTLIIRYRELMTPAIEFNDPAAELTSRIYVEQSATDFLQNPIAFGVAVFKRGAATTTTTTTTTTLEPSLSPVTTAPSAIPTAIPSAVPSIEPTATPSSSPTKAPTVCVENLIYDVDKEDPSESRASSSEISDSSGGKFYREYLRFLDGKPHIRLMLPCDLNCWVKIKLHQIKEVNVDLTGHGRTSYHNSMVGKVIDWNLTHTLTEDNVILGSPAKTFTWTGTVTIVQEYSQKDTRRWRKKRHHRVWNRPNYDIARVTTTVPLTFQAHWLYQAVTVEDEDDNGGKRVSGHGLKFSWQIDWPWFEQMATAVRFEIDIRISKTCPYWKKRGKLKAVDGQHFEEYVWDGFLFLLSAHGYINPDHFWATVSQWQIRSRSKNRYLERYYRVQYDISKVDGNIQDVITYDPYMKVFGVDGYHKLDIAERPADMGDPPVAIPAHKRATFESTIGVKPGLFAACVVGGFVFLCFVACCTYYGWGNSLRRCCGCEFGTAPSSTAFTRAPAAPVTFAPTTVTGLHGTVDAQPSEMDDHLEMTILPTDPAAGVSRSPLLLDPELEEA